MLIEKMKRENMGAPLRKSAKIALTLIATGIPLGFIIAFCTYPPLPLPKISANYIEKLNKQSISQTTKLSIACCSLQLA